MFEKVVKVIRAILIFILAAFAVYATIDSIFNGLSTNITQTNVVNAATTQQPKISQVVETEEKEVVTNEEEEPKNNSNDVINSEIQVIQDNIYGLTYDDRKKMAKTLFRESNRPCAGDTESSKVVWTMLNRFDEGFDDDMEDILAASYDFREESPVTEENIALVNDVVCRWVAEKNGISDVGRTLPRDFYYFWGDGQKNHFYKYSSGGIGQSGDSKIAYDDSLATPYSS